MEISGKVPAIKIDAYLNNVKNKNKADGSSSSSPDTIQNEDTVKLSQNVRDVKEAREQLDSIPDVREEKVAEIKEQLEKGTYNVDGKKIALNMIKESLIDEIV